MTWLQRITLLGILLVALGLRLTGLDWDEYHHFHPDERYITWIATTIELPKPGDFNLATGFNPIQSDFNPFHWSPKAGSEGIVVLQGQPRDFAYGHLPLYLGVAATRVAETVAPFLRWLPENWTLSADVLNRAGRIEYHHLAAVGRALTALFDAGTVLLLFMLGRELYNTNVALLAAAFLAVTVMHIQQAHFFISDPYLVFFVTLTILLLVTAWRRYAQDSRVTNTYLLAAAVAMGLAIGSKFNAVLLVIPLVWVIWTVSGDLRRRMMLLGLTLPAALLAFAITNPFAILDWTCHVPLTLQFPANASPLVLDLRSCYMSNVLAQNAMVRGDIDLGFTRQYADTLPYVYFVEMQLRWGMGPLLGVVAFAGLMWSTARQFAGLRAAGNGVANLRSQGEVIALLWVWPYFLVTGSFYVKFMRYMMPITPFLLLFGAGLLYSIKSVRLRRASIALVLVFSGLYALSFVSIYREEHPWTSASRWLYDNAAPGALLLSEQYDDYLPATMNHDGELRRREEYRNAELTWLTFPDAGDDEANLRANVELLAEGEFVTILSNRVYGVVARLDSRYPLSGHYHQALFDGSLGYEPVWVGGRYPGLAGVHLKADTFGWPNLNPPSAVSRYLSDMPGLSLGRADESFLVYDQPLTMIFRNTGALSAEQMYQVLIDEIQ